MDFEFRFHEMYSIEREAQTPRSRALEMLRQLHTKMSPSDFSLDDIRERIRKIKRKQYDAQLKSNV